jgi:hypothetical protein
MVEDSHHQLFLLNDLVLILHYSHFRGKVHRQGKIQELIPYYQLKPSYSRYTKRVRDREIFYQVGPHSHRSKL